MVKIYLKKCCYLYDSSARTYFFNKKDYEEALKRRAFFKAYYEQPEKCKTPLEAEKINDSYYIKIDGESFKINLQMIASTNDNHFLNDFRPARLANFESPNFEKRIYSDNSDFWHKKLKTLHVEDFTTEEKTTLDFIRIHFKNNSLKIMIDKNNDFYNFESYNKIDRKYIYSRLEILSSIARNAIDEILNFITEDSNDD